MHIIIFNHGRDVGRRLTGRLDLFFLLLGGGRQIGQHFGDAVEPEGEKATVKIQVQLHARLVMHCDVYWLIGEVLLNLLKIHFGGHFFGCFLDGVETVRELLLKLVEGVFLSAHPGGCVGLQSFSKTTLKSTVGCIDKREWDRNWVNSTLSERMKVWDMYMTLKNAN